VKQIFLKVVFCLGLSLLCAVAEEETNLVAAISKDEDAGWESVFAETNQIPFHVNLYMKDGLYYEIMESGAYDADFYTSIFSEQRRFTGRLGATLHTDLALYHETGDLPSVDSGITVRRFYVNTFGRGYFLSPMTYGLEFGISDGSFFFKNGYAWFHEVPVVESVKFGFFKAPMALESLQSSSGTMMMERAAPVGAFAPEYKFGLQLGGALKNQRSTFYGGWFADGANSDEGDASQSYTRLMGRGTWLASGASKESSKLLLHLGASVSQMFTKDDGARYRARPESYLVPHLIDTGPLGGNSALGYGLEAALVEGPFSLQSEMLGSFADDQAGDDHHFFGAYLTGSWFLTGESRPYNRAAGTFSPVKPHQKFSFKNNSWGALEAVGRISFTDLTDGSVRGGEMTVLSAGFNIYLTQRHRIMLDGGMANVDRSANDEGKIYFIQSRLQLEF